jgi:lantibiotic modifying enzyme
MTLETTTLHQASAPAPALADPALAAAADACVGELAAALLDAGPDSLPDPWLADGDAGLALFHCQAAQHLGSAEHADRALFHLERAVEVASTADLSPSLYGGVAGVGWTLAHLAARFAAAGLAVEPDEESLAALDELLIELVSPSPWSLSFDLLQGLAGLAVYAAERWPAPGARPLLAGIAQRLAETAVPQPVGLAWPQRLEWIPEALRDRHSDGALITGVAHGAPSAICALALATRCGCADAALLLEPAVAWLLAQRLDDGRFPHRLVPGAAAEPPERNAWCYGDLGIATALLTAATLTGRGTWRDAAIAIGRASAGAADAPAFGAVDGGFCHGAAGIAHCFHRLYLGTGEPAFASAFRDWLRLLLSMRRPGRGVAGLQFWGLREPETGTEGWVDDRSLLSGAAGVGLVLLAGLRPSLATWDRLFLLSVPAGLEAVHGS